MSRGEDDADAGPRRIGGRSARLRGHTLIGEQRYVYGPDVLRPIAFGRQALHAARLVLRHPLTDQPLTLEAPLPNDLQDLLTALRRSPRPR